jgi:hypothetical protein
MNAIVDTSAVAPNAEATKALADWTMQTLQSGLAAFEAARELAKRLGAHRRGDVCEVLFWAPELQEQRVFEGDIFVEVLDIEGEVTLVRARQTLTFRRTRVPVARIDAWCMAAIDGMRAGTREHVGSFYSLVWRDPENQ